MLNNKLLGQPKLSQLAKNVICGPFGSAILNSDYKERGIPLLRVNNLNNDFINCEDIIYIEENLSDSLKRYQVFSSDIVVSQRGTVAMFSLVTDEYKKYNISANLISILNSKSINFLYLLAFLNSKFGLSQILRKVSGQVQEKITTDDIKSIIIFLPQEKFQNEVAHLVLKSEDETKNSKLLYKQAESLLLEESGIKDFEYDKILFSIVNLSEVENANRIDAEYFQEKYKKLVKKIKLNKAKKLGDLVSIKKGFEPGSEEYFEEGKLFIRVSSLSVNGINLTEEKYLSEKLYQELKKDYKPEVGEILLTKDATPGIAYTIKEPVEGIMSGGILRLKLKENIDAEYLTLCLNSIIGKMQAKRDSGGSVIAHWKPEQIKNIVIPILPKESQQKIAKLVWQSYEARKKAKELLNEAKKKVEDIIDKGGDK
ncbi:MAG: restriction endonuclease subunit S [bacterium]|nr:restriction endonuclease subunit S [bacterium]